MCGGFLRRGADFASLYLINFIEAARHLGQSWGILFLDVSAAFESMQHFFVFSAPPSDEHIASIFNTCGFSHSIFQEFVTNVAQPHACTSAGVPHVLAKLIASAHCLSWFSCNGLDTYVASRQGAKAGDPLGDITFAFLICRVLKHIHTKFSHLCNHNHVVLDTCHGIFGQHSSAVIDLTSINYVDDNAFPIMADSPDKLINTMQHLATQVIDIFASYLLKCMLAANKTAILLGLKGKKQKWCY